MLIWQSDVNKFETFVFDLYENFILKTPPGYTQKSFVRR